MVRRKVTGWRALARIDANGRVRRGWLLAPGRPTAERADAKRCFRTDFGSGNAFVRMTKEDGNSCGDEEEARVDTVF
jgi:hypothetical protein